MFIILTGIFKGSGNFKKIEGDREQKSLGSPELDRTWDNVIIISKTNSLVTKMHLTVKRDHGMNRRKIIADFYFHVMIKFLRQC